MNVVVGLYSQIPLGTGAPVMQRVLSCVLKPVLTYLYANEDCKFVLHLSVAEMEWLKCNHEEINMLITELVKRKQLELLTGGYYQPIQQLQQIKDRSSQIEKMITYIRRHFGMRCKTLWCYDQIWNPANINAMNLCATDRLMISTYDRIHGKQLETKPFRMQETGKAITVYPIDDYCNEQVSNYANGICSLHDMKKKIVSHVKQRKNEPYLAVMLNIDQLCQGSAISERPQDAQEVWSIIADLYETITLDHCDSVLFDDIEELQLDIGHGYLPASWYGRDSIQTRGMNSFNDVLVNNDELNQLYGRLVFVQDVVRNYKKNKDIRKRAESLLERACTGVPYVSDSYGSAMQPLYRKLVYKYLNEAEQLIANQPDIVYPTEFDVDFDQSDEYLSIGKNISAVIDPKGASIIELNYLPAGWNYADTYKYKDTAFDDRPVTKRKVFEDLICSSFDDLLDANTASYTVSEQYFNMTRIDRKGSEFHAHGTISLEDELPLTLDVVKKFKFRQNTIILDIELTNLAQSPVRFMYGCIMNLSIGTKTGRISLYSFEGANSQLLSDGDMHVKQIRNIKLMDEVNKSVITVTSDTKFSLVKEDVHGEYLTLMGKERLYLQTMLLPSWEVELQPLQTETFRIALRIERR